MAVVMYYLTVFAAGLALAAGEFKTALWIFNAHLAWSMYFRLREIVNQHSKGVYRDNVNRKH